jgi:hypothetical protein
MMILFYGRWQVARMMACYYFMPASGHNRTISDLPQIGFRLKGFGAVRLAR